VHLALASRRAEFQRLVVVKTIREQASHSAEARALFMEEARLSARLNHPNVVRVTEIVELEHGAMLVMEYLDGLCLADALRATGEAFTLPLRIRAICEALAGLHYAHRLADYDGRPLGIVHRDVSPQNIFLTYDGCVKLLDFGIAKADDTERATRTGILKGRISYMSPEQIRGDVLDCRADVYAMGCVLFEMLANRRLWGSIAQGEIVRAVAEGRIPRLDESFDAELRAIVDRAMAYSRDERFSSADEMRLALERYLDGLPGVGQVLARDIGDMLAATCSERRDRRQREITEAIQRIERERSEAPTPVVPPPTRPVHVEVPQAAALPQGLERPLGGDLEAQAPEERQEASSQGTGTGLWRTEATATKGRGLPWFAYALPAALLIAAVALIAPRLMEDSEALQAAATAEAEPTLHEVVVEVEPATATIFLDGTELGVGRGSARLPEGSAHVLRVVHDGYEAVERTFVSEADTRLAIELTPASEAEDTSAKASRRAASARASAVAPGAVGAGDPEAISEEGGEAAASDSEEAEPSARTKPRRSSGVASGRKSADVKGAASASKGSDDVNCKPPYYFSGGVKTYKPECI